MKYDRLAVCLGLGLSCVSFAGPNAVADAGNRAGSLISQTPIKGAPNGASAWRILYRSQAANGKIVTISGAVIVPAGQAPKEGRDIVSWGHATTGIAESCGPSTSPTLYGDIAGLPGMLAAGYVVTATDFQGLGTPGPHPYLVGIDSGRAMIDAARAVRSMSEVSAGKRYVMWGESQGAHAALWGAQIAAKYAPDLTLLGVAAAAPPTDIIANFARLTNPLIRSLLTGFTSDSWSQIYGIKLSTFANPVGRFFIRRLAKDCIRLDAVASATDTTLLLLSRSLPDHLGKPWTTPLRDNSVKPEHLDVPVLIAQDTKDDVVIPQVTKTFVKKSCEAGDKLRFVVIPGGSHTTIGARSADVTLSWIADRFANRPAPSDCAAIDNSVGD